MRRTFTCWLVGAALALAAITMTGFTTPVAQAASLTVAIPAYAPPAGIADPCPATSSGTAGCATLISAPSATAQPAASGTPTGYAPADLLNAYQLPSGMGSGAMVAVVTAFDDPNAEADLGTYRGQYGMAACTIANGCFKKVNQSGGTSYPPASAGWSAPAAESIDMISAICPKCHIILVEATTSTIADLGTAENEAVTLGARFIDNDWIIPETQAGSAETTYDSSYFHHPGDVITAPAGDSGYGVNYPAASPYVTAVGGTTLTRDSGVSRGWDETAWSGTGSGCSAYEPKPSWQSDTGCANRALNDVAAVGDPGTPVAFYDSPTAGGWGIGGGTTVAAAIIAAAYALTIVPAAQSNPASFMYIHPGALNAIASGSNGTCTPSYLCTAGSGYNGPAGNGTPLQDTAFQSDGARPAAVTGTDGKTWVFVTTTSGAIEADSLPAGSSTWSGFTNLGSPGGGTWSSYPSALAASDGTIWVFAIADGSLFVNDLTPGSTTWGGWGGIGNPGDDGMGNPPDATLVGRPTAVQDHSGGIMVFARGASTGNLYEATKLLNFDFSLLVDLGGTLPNDVSAIVDTTGTLYIVGVGADSELFYDKVPPGGGFSGWTGVSGSTVTGVPAIIQDAAGNDRVFVRRTSDGAIMHNEIPAGHSTWTGFTSLGGTLVNSPAAYGGSGGTVWAFVIGPGSFINYDRFGSSWSGWTGISSGFTGVPAVSQDKTEGLHLFGRSTSGNLEADYLPGGTTTWPAFTSLGGPIAGS